MPGPSVRTDIVDVYVFHRTGVRPGGVNLQFLQLHRAGGAMSGTWQPVMGHVEEQESAVQAALRELREETGFAAGAEQLLVGFWQLETLNSYFLARHDCIMHSPCFAAQVRDNAEPVLDAAHDGHRWVDGDQVDRLFMWPGQRGAVEHIVRDLMAAEAPVAEALRIDLGAQ